MSIYKDYIDNYYQARLAKEIDLDAFQLIDED